jgi:hypothetical protein
MLPGYLLGEKRGPPANLDGADLEGALKPERLDGAE